MFSNAGFHAVEIPCPNHPSRSQIEDCGDIRDLLHVTDDLGMKIRSIHVPDRASLVAKDKANRRMQIETVQRFIDIAGELAAPVLCSHTRGNLHGEKTDSGSVLRLRESTHQLEGCLRGVSVKVCFETTPFPGGNGVVTNTELVAEVQKLKQESFGFLLDVGHSNTAGDLYGTAQLAGRRLQHVHIHDNDGIDDLHQIPGMGTIDWAQFIGDLRDAQYEGPLMLEIAGLDENPSQAALEKCHQAVEWLRHL